MKRGWGRVVVGAAAGIGLGLLALAPGAVAAGKQAAAPAPALSEEAAAALVSMGKTLLSPAFSFQVQTIRVQDGSDPPGLHIFHTLNVTVRRPDRMQATSVGDDATTKLFYDGKTLGLINVSANRYTTLPVGDTIQKMMEEAMGKLQIDFPLADFLTEAPNKAFLTGVTAGKQVDLVTVDGAPCRHLVFTQPPGITLELWLEMNEQALPRRLIVTYNQLPGSPSFIALFSNWDFSVHPEDAAFQFTPPPGATKIDLSAAAAAAKSR